MNPNPGGTLSQTVAGYIKSVWSGFESATRSLKTALPYLLNVRSGELKKEVTEQYPDPVSSRGADELPARSRGLLFNDIERCTGCGECAKVCPTRCISVETEPGASSSKIWVSVFDVDFSTCTFCGLCTQVCLPTSLTHTRQYEGSVFQLTELVSSFGRGRVTPEQRRKWAEVRRLKEVDDEGSST
jgi:NADH-quinone oxidoreductase subunit I